MVHLERWFCRRNFHFSEVEVTERVISTLLPMEWKLLFHFRSRFALPVFSESGEIIRYNVFDVIMVVRHAKDGKMYLYDIMNIKKETSTLFLSEDFTQ